MKENYSNRKKKKLIQIIIYQLI